MLLALIHSWCASLRDLNHNSLRALVRRCAFPIGQYECFKKIGVNRVWRECTKGRCSLCDNGMHTRNEGLHTASSKSSWCHLPCHHMAWLCWPSSIMLSCNMEPLHTHTRNKVCATVFRQRGDSNPCGQSPIDFELISLAAQTHCLGRTF